jgi:predicted nuclease with TOPRIM domain
LALYLFSKFEALLPTYPAFRIEEYQRTYSLKASLLGKIASQRLVEREEITKKLSKESMKLKRDFNLAQTANVDLEKKVSELADALKRCQDEKQVAEDRKRAAEKPSKIVRRISRSCRKLTMMT